VSPESSSLKSRLIRELISWLWVALAFLLITGTIVQARVIPSESMENTLLVGDHLLVSRLGYGVGLPFTHYQVRLWREPHRQQMVVFHAPLPGTDEDFIKRMIGLPGDRIKIVDQHVFVNDQRQAEPFVYYDPVASHDSFPDNFPPANRNELLPGMDPAWSDQIFHYIHGGELVVPPNEYFVMGDNRDDSYDSRYWGFVPEAAILGTPVLIYMSVDAPDDAWQPGQVRERMFAYLNAILHPRLVRWHRLFRLF
jgi:signal peptidase I